MMNSDRILAVVLFLFSVFMFVMSFSIPPGTLGTGTAGPSFFPQIWAVILAVLSILMFIKSAPEDSEYTHKGLIQSLREYKKVIYMLSASLAYIFLLGILGYIITTLLFLIVTIPVLAAEAKVNKLKILFIAAAITFSTYVIFQHVLNVFLPAGRIF
ncbi:tripartite tricarboxylate transporter TctB family protein [Salipaludibacillus aurantiacus]|uniref:Tripartite tricarboxylate transporter TctB family protein n=1 Tax=Salipaludibacillus aurantiacus TaxID=1601833 RepID=A0A1H9URB6_9BACI|nr:tripartite tricarboxylate transporter TctB family protein [Salipaludibacillus aurantiacus]SES11563.1 Tripartite tricarboxylate transporter TctB family protein [Salipaludibacillus aurantiacus]